MNDDTYRIKAVKVLEEGEQDSELLLQIDPDGTLRLRKIVNQGPVQDIPTTEV